MIEILKIKLKTENEKSYHYQMLREKKVPKKRELKKGRSSNTVKYHKKSR